MHNYIIAPSILSANLAILGEEVTTVIQAGADAIHFDVMDNHYVPNLTFGPDVCKALIQYGITVPIDVHIMARPVDALIQQFAQAGASQITIHPDATIHLDRSVQQIKALGCKAGIAINPAEPLNCLDYIADELDNVLIMSVNPGFGGQKFIPRTYQKIQQLYQYRAQHKLKFHIQVDGGVCVDNIAKIAQHGADSFVAGSAVFGQEDYARVLNDMRKQLLSVSQP